MHPKDTISEEFLSEAQRKIIKKEASALSKKNVFDRWIGYEVEDGWRFMRHGFEVIHINEEKGNIARIRLVKILGRKYL